MKLLSKALSIVLCTCIMLYMFMPSAVLTASAEGAAIEPATNLPSIYITLNGDVKQGDIDKDNYITANYSIVGSEEFADITDEVLGIKGRGNSTWGLPKKPYALKLDSKTDLLGLGKSKKWVLLANYWDKTLMRNYITLKLAEDLGLPGTTACAFVDVFINDEYQGNYLLTEKVEIGTNRVEIDDENGGVLFEIEQQYRHDDCTYCYETAKGVHLTYKEPEADDFDEEFMQSLMTTNNKFLADMELSLENGLDSYSQYIDVDSFVNWYILNELVKNYDSQFVTSCYSYRDVDGKLFMGPVWDYDTCYGNQSASSYGAEKGWLITNAPWYRILLDDSDFSALVKERWTELKESGIISGLLDNINTADELISESRKLDNETWPDALTDESLRGDDETQRYKTYEEELDYLRNFISRVSLWIDEQWNTDYNSTENKVDNLQILAFGLLDTKFGKTTENFDLATDIFDSLNETAKSQLSEDIKALIDPNYIDLVEMIEQSIENLDDVTSYKQITDIKNIRAKYDGLADAYKDEVSNYSALVEAEQALMEIGKQLGFPNVARNDITNKIDLTSLIANPGFAREEITNLFDINTQTKYCTRIVWPANIQFGMVEPTKISSYAFATANDMPERNPNDWKLYGSDDGENWTVVDTVTSADLPLEFYTYKEFIVDNPQEFLYYKFEFTSNLGDIDVLQLSEMLLGTADYLLGDADGDGRLTVTDIVLLRSFIMNDKTPAETQFDTVDIDKDGKLTVSDIVALRKLIMN